MDSKLDKKPKWTHTCIFYNMLRGRESGMCICACVYRCIQVCSCIYVCIHMGIHVCWYVCVHVNVEPGGCQVLFIRFCPGCFWRQGVSLAQLRLRSLPVSAPKPSSTRLTGTWHHVWLFYVGSDEWIRVLNLVQKVLDPLNTLLRPQMCFYFNHMLRSFGIWMEILFLTIYKVRNKLSCSAPCSSKQHPSQAPAFIARVGNRSPFS